MKTKKTQYAVRGTQYAFTLIELLVSVSVFAVIGVVLYSSFRAGVVSWRRINSEIALQQKIRYASDRIARDFKNMVFLSNLPFEGSADKVEFVSQVESAAGQAADTVRVSYYLSLDEEGVTGAALVRQEESIKDALSLEGSKEQEKLNLLDGISDLKFSYLVVYKESGEDEKAEYEWVDLWEEEEALPMGIRVGFTLTDPESNSSITLSKRIYIPAGKPLEKPQGFKEE